jgi:phosphatidylserine/phosphatidylglycerophosphate/cardiolipin synthase-like enzyme
VGPPDPRRLSRSLRRSLLFAILLLVLFLVFLRTSSRPSPGPAGTASGSIEVFFSRPDAASASFRGGPDAHLAQAIDAAQRTIEMAIYDLDLWSVRDALLRAHARGVDVRLVVESDNLDQPELAALIAAGIPVVADELESLMHDKFTVLDDREVWTGSMNYTVNDAYRNDNNLVRLRSASAAEVYRDEFEEMFSARAFGALSPPGEGRSLRLDDGSKLEIYFAPDDRPLPRLLELIRGADASIDFLAFSFTSPELAQALAEKARDGVRVRGVIEAGQAENLGSQWGALRRGGLDVLIDANPANMHHKVLILDGRTVVFGSYNLSRSAEASNDENLVVAEVPALADGFEMEFERIYRAAASAGPILERR